MFIEPDDYSGPFVVLWVHMAGYKNCVKTKHMKVRWMDVWSVVEGQKAQ